METGAEIDVVHSGGAVSGTLAQRLLETNFSVDALRPCADPNSPHVQATLRRDEWIQYDTAIIEVAQQRLVGVQDLMSRGLTYDLPNALGKTSIEWETVSDMDEAETSMAGVTRAQNDRIDFDITSMPVPIVHKEFSLNIRALNASRTTGTALDTTQARLATRKVTEKIEQMLYLGSTVIGSNSPIYGYTTAPNRNTGSVTASWVTATGTQMLTDLIAMINAANAVNMYGPFIMYVPLAVFTHMGEDFKAESDKSIMTRLLETPNLTEIKSSETLTGTNILLVQMTSDVIDIIDGIQPTAVQWETEGGFVQNFKVMAIMPPRVKSTYTTQSGIVHYS